MKKFDQGKVRMGLLPFDTLKEIAKVMTFGAEKYDKNGWRYIENAYERYEDALLRHLEQHKSGEIYDDESGLYHLSHLACNALFMLWHYMNPEVTEIESVRHDEDGNVNVIIRPVIPACDLSEEEMENTKTTAVCDPITGEIYDNEKIDFSEIL